MDIWTLSVLRVIEKKKSGIMRYVDYLSADLIYYSLRHVLCVCVCVCVCVLQRNELIQ